MEAPVTSVRLNDLYELTERRSKMRIRSTIYALASLAALAMAIGAGWKPR